MQTSSPPLNGFVDASTGQPLFAPPRQSARLEIRAPTDGLDGRAAKERKPSNLRSSTITASVGADDDVQHSNPQPLGPVHMHPHVSAPSGLARFASAPEYFPSDPNMRAYPSTSENGADVASPSQEEGAMMGHIHGHVMDPNMMAYNPYQQQYYYPEQYYGAYMEVPQGAGQYDPYAVDPRHQQTVYY